VASGDWISVMVELPAVEGQELITYLQNEKGFRDIDWCELQRPDFARVSWSPCPPRTDSGYTIPPFGETP
jgi:hypothetical protein